MGLEGPDPHELSRPLLFRIASLRGDRKCDYILVLAGDHLYRMDYGKMLREHIEKDAEITVAVLPVARDRVKQLGILRAGSAGTSA